MGEAVGFDVALQHFSLSAQFMSLTAIGISFEVANSSKFAQGEKLKSVLGSRLQLSGQVEGGRRSREGERKHGEEGVRTSARSTQFLTRKSRIF